MTRFCALAVLFGRFRRTGISKVQMYASISLWPPGLLQLVRCKPRHHLGGEKRLLQNVF